MLDLYDGYFQRFAARFFEDTETGTIMVSWPWFKAQAMAESSLDPFAVSGSGAMGLMQLMPDTIKLMVKRLQVYEEPFDPRWSIMAGIRYDRHLWDIFKKEKGLERLRFVLGAYNAGPGNIIKAQRHTDRPNIWEAVSHELEAITGPKNSLQTRTYVKRVERYRLQIIED